METAMLEGQPSDEQEQQFSFGTQLPKRPAESLCEMFPFVWVFNA